MSISMIHNHMYDLGEKKQIHWKNLLSWVALSLLPNPQKSRAASSSPIVRESDVWIWGHLFLLATPTFQTHVAHLPQLLSQKYLEKFRGPLGLAMSVSKKGKYFALSTNVVSWWDHIIWILASSFLVPKSENPVYLHLLPGLYRFFERGKCFMFLKKKSILHAIRTTSF